MRQLFTVCAIAASLAWTTTAARAQQATAPPLRNAGAADLADGKRIFDGQCAWCHGTNGAGGTGPMLQQPALRHAPSDSALVELIRNGIPGTEMPSFALGLTEHTAWQTAAYVRSLGRTSARVLTGDRRRGEAVYQSAGCASCHTVAGRGGTLGPELTAIGAMRGAGHLRESILNPAATHPAGYLVVRATTTAGREVRGIRVNEDVFWVQIRDAGGTVHVLEKADISRLDRELDGTLMPSYASRLSRSELDDLVAYLSSLRGTS
jgi:putative heme-binding domain-containing protein